MIPVYHSAHSYAATAAGIFRSVWKVAVICVCCASGIVLQATSVYGQSSDKPWHNVRDYGAVPGTADVQTKAFQRAVDIIRNEGGGTLYVPAGVYTLGTLELCDNINVYLEAGSVLVASDDTVVYQRSFGKVSAMLYAGHAKNIRITGAGTLRGNPHYIRKEAIKYDFIARQYDLAKAAGLDLTVPARQPPHVTLLLLQECSNVQIDGISIVNSPFWAVHLQWCNTVKINSISIQSDLTNGVNSDGLDIDGCHDVVVTNCYISTGDDAIVLKTTSTHGQHRSCENISVTNCVLESTSCALKLGTESYDDFRHIRFSDCIIKNTNRGLGIFIRDGGKADGVVFENIMMQCSRKDFPWWGDGEMATFLCDKRSPQSAAGSIRNITLRNIDAEVEGTSVFLSEIESSIQNLTLKGVAIRMHTETATDIRATHAISFKRISGLTLYDLSIDDSGLEAYSENRAINIEVSQQIYVKDLRIHYGHLPKLPPIRLSDVHQVRIRDVEADGRLIIETNSKSSSEIALSGISNRQVLYTNSARGRSKKNGCR